jgi:hypothetical protein
MAARQQYFTLPLIAHPRREIADETHGVELIDRGSAAIGKPMEDAAKQHHFRLS